MFNETHFNHSRPNGALEIARRARAKEKSMALLVCGIKAKTSRKQSNFFNHIIATLLAGLR